MNKRKFLGKVLCLPMLFVPFFACSAESEIPSDWIFESDDANRYLVFQITNIAPEQLESWVEEIKNTFGPSNKSERRFIAFGPLCPLLLKDSVAELREKIETGFDLAERYDVPVYFQLDDVNFVSKDLADDPRLCEWISFPAAGAEYGQVSRYWFNWGAWGCLPAFPCLGSPHLREFVVTQLREGVLPCLRQRLYQLQETGREHLFAGVAIGWETHIPNYTPGVPPYQMDPTNPPVAQAGEAGVKMATHEMTKLGYGTLHWEGYDAERLAQESIQSGKTEAGIFLEVCSNAIQDYSGLLAKTVFDAGVPRHRIFTHIVPMDSIAPTDTAGIPPIRCAVNPWSIPGFTMSQVTAPYDMDGLKTKIASEEPGLSRFICAESYFVGKNRRTEYAASLSELFGSGASHVVVWGLTDPPTSYYAAYPRDGATRAAWEWIQTGQ